jgi:hypothetical protein
LILKQDRSFPGLSPIRHKRQHSGNGNRLDIKPSGPHHKPVGKNLFFTCKADVSNPQLVRDLKWLKPNGQNIPEDDRQGFWLTFQTFFFFSADFFTQTFGRYQNEKQKSVFRKAKSNFEGSKVNFPREEMVKSETFKG